MKRPPNTLTADRLLQPESYIFVNRAVEDFNLPLHSHDFIEFAYIAEGRGFHHIEDEVHPVYKGQLFVLPVGVSHVFRPASANSAKNPLVVYNCVFTPKAIDLISGIIADEAIAVHLNTLQTDSPGWYSVFDTEGTIEGLFIRMHREYTLPRAGSLTCLHSLLLQLVVDTYRLKTASASPLEQHADNLHFMQVLQYVEQHFSEDVTLAELAGMCRWSERHLQRLFKQHTGQTFRGYLQNVRIRKSCEALRTTREKISAIAENAGYKDIDSFTAVFKRIVGKSPGAYRRQPHGDTSSK
ncbi:AraC family transcriptional regulator [Paenibacillus hamazuiensis]|uniref:AraC family transcriptional regulator n=1 Tax=Paenibacillus hamazuiensis TaxID=2936508 RepID=UPI00200D5389|nr:AraC family transcriptional regulator [Paenibacillus hamazuiensis]